jgi:iron complex outermembrane receptor protein
MRIRRLDGLLWALLTAFAGTAGAETEDFFDFSLDDLSMLKVTAASAFAETSLDSSASVSVVTRDDWERRGARTLPNAVAHLPGVMLLPVAAGGQLIQVRSYDSTSLRGRATLIDGVPINTFAFGTDVFSNSHLQLPVLDSIELVRGPSSILYGSDAFHSALIATTLRRQGTDRLDISGTAGDNDYQAAAGRGEINLTPDHTLLMAIAATHQGDQDIAYPYVVGGIEGEAQRAQRYDAGTAMLRWEGRNDGLGYHVQLFTDHVSAKEFPGGGRATGDTVFLDRGDQQAALWMIKGGLKASTGDNLSWAWDNYYWRNDYGQNYYLPSARGFFNDDQEFIEHRYGTKLQLVRTNWSLLGSDAQVAGTATYENAGVDNHDFTRTLLNGLPTSQSFRSYEGLDQTIGSLAIESKLRWQNGVYQMLLGGRVDNYSSFGTQASPRIGAIWLPSRNQSVKLIYGEAFRAPNANELRGTQFFAGTPDLNPETLNSYELSYTHVRNTLRFELVAFESRWHDRIILQRSSLRYVNVGESKSHGVEISANYVENNWRIESSVSLIRNRNLDTGEETTVFPNWIVSLGIGYRWPREQVELFWANRLHESVKTGDEALPFTPQLPDAKTYWRSDLTLKQQWSDNWSGRIALRNLFDRDNVWPSVLSSRDGIPDIPRQVSFEIEYRR